MDNKVLKIKWKRLVIEDKTCPRCGLTEEELDKAIETLRQSLEILGVKVILEKEEVTISDFKTNPLQSNEIWINELPLESYIGGTVGKSPCCDVCGSSECRTVEIQGIVYETITYEIIIKSGLIAASRLFISKLY